MKVESSRRGKLIREKDRLKSPEVSLSLFLSGSYNVAELRRKCRRGKQQKMRKGVDRELPAHTVRTAAKTNLHRNAQYTRGNE